MRKISTSEQSRMVAVAVSSFNDLCDIYSFVDAIDPLSGQNVGTWGTGAVVKYDDIDYNLFEYVGGWAVESDPLSYFTTYHISNTPGDYVLIHITGSQFILYGFIAPFAGVCDVYFDGIKIDSFDEGGLTFSWEAVYTSPVFDFGAHVIKIVVVSTDAVLDAVEVTTTATLSNSPCGFSVGPQSRNERGQIITIDADAVLRTAASIKVMDKVIVRGVTYIVDGVTPGRDVTIAALKEIKI